MTRHGQDLLLELLQVRSGVEPQLISQLGLDPLVRRECIRLTSRSVQRRDQQLPQALPKGVRGYRRFQLTGHVGSEPEPRGT